MGILQKIIELSNPEKKSGQITKSSNYQITISSNQQIFKSSN